MKIERASRTLPGAVLAALVGLAIGAGTAAAQKAGAEGAEPTEGQGQGRVIQVKILGMSCPFCAYGAEQKLKRLEGVKELEVELESGMATLTMKESADVPNAKLRKAVGDAGFEAAAIVRSFESEHEDWHPEKLRGEGGAATGGTGR